MFSNPFLKSFRILLLPFSILFWMIIGLRNWLYNKNIFKASTFGLPLICVGNLSVGGTGKSPMVEYLVMHLKSSFKVATLSRGYKRKTKGYALANSQSTALEIGDEPMLFHRKFPQVPVAVGEERIVAIPQILHDRPDTEVIILDDAFQHRAIAAGFNILLTDYGNLFTRDFYLPTGDLRDLKSSSKRADVIIVTKCPAKIDATEAAAIKDEIGPASHQKIFFTTIVYGTPYHITQHHFSPLHEETEVLLITGIANPKPLKAYLEERMHSYHMLHYSDHHIFTIDDWRDITKRFKRIESENKMIITTEKDAVRLQKFAHEINGMPFFVLPIEHKFLFLEGTAFTETVVSFIQQFKKPK